MKTAIEITGQINSVLTLFNSLKGSCQVRNLRFNGKFLIYETKKEAIKSLSGAFQSLKFNDPEYYKEGGISYCRGGSLSYGAATARINNHV